MQKSDLNILIVDDDATIGKALSEAFTRAGFRALHVSKPDEALATTKLQSIHAAIVDCMLPKMNGRELVLKLKKEISSDLPIVLVSGIYRDKGFAREAIQHTGAIGFFAKPFDIQEIVSTIESKLERLIENPLNPLQETLTKDELSHRARIRAINDQGTFHGFDLPLVCSLLMHSKISGNLNILSADGEVCGIGFRDGDIVHVNRQDDMSYFGILLVEGGFVTQEEIEETLQSSISTNKKIGERLVDANVVSPHGIQIVMAEQMSLRLSKVISNTTLQLNFIETSDLRQDERIDRNLFFSYVNEWLTSKLSPEWLKSFYMRWMRFNIKKGAEFSTTHRILTLPVVQQIPSLVPILLDAPNLEQGLAKLTESESQVYQAIHALMLSRVLRFGEASQVIDFNLQRTRIKRLDAELAKQDHFQRLGLSNKAKEAEVKRAFIDLAKILHPDKLGPGVPEDVRELARSAFGKINEAYEVLSSPAKKEQYLLEIEKGRAEAIMEAEQLTDYSRSLLAKGDFKKALELLEKAFSLAPPTPTTRLLLMWAKLKSPQPHARASNGADIKSEFSLIPPEDRHTGIYHFVRALHLRQSGDLDGARRSLEHAISLDHDLVEAKRELTLLKTQSGANKPVDILRGDLKDVVGLLFKKK